MKILSHRLIEKIPLPAYVTGSIISVVSVIGFLFVSERSGLLAQTLSGEVESTNLRASLTLMVLVGYLPIAHWYLRRWNAFHIGELNERFDLSDERRVPEEKILIPLGLFGWASFIGLFLVLPDPGGFVLQLWNWSLDFAVVFIVMSLVGWWTGRFSYELIWSAIQMAKRLPAVDLLETSAYKPFTQHGVHSILLIVIMMSITMHLVAAPGSSLIGSVVNSVTMLTLAIIALILPMRGMHLRIREQKYDELDLLKKHIHEERIELLEKTSRSSDRLVGLLAMETRIERVYEWPFDVGSLSKVLLYLMLGLGSWVGAALVERLLENAL